MESAWHWPSWIWKHGRTFGPCLWTRATPRTPEEPGEPELFLRTPGIRNRARSSLLTAAGLHIPRTTPEAMKFSCGPSLRKQEGNGRFQLAAVCTQSGPAMAGSCSIKLLTAVSWSRPVECRAIRLYLISREYGRTRDCRFELISVGPRSGADGKRFAVIPKSAGSAEEPHVTFLLNFFDYLRRQVPPRGK